MTETLLTLGEATDAKCPQDDKELFYLQCHPIENETPYKIANTE